MEREEPHLRGLSDQLRAQEEALSALGFEGMRITGVLLDQATGETKVGVAGCCAGHPLRLSVPVEAIPRLASYLDLKNAQSAAPTLYRLSCLLQAQALDHAIASWLESASLKGAVRRVETMEIPGERIQRSVEFYGKTGELLLWVRLRYMGDSVGVRVREACVLVEVLSADESQALGVERVRLSSEEEREGADVANALNAVLSSLAIRGTVKSLAQRLERVFARSA